MELTPQAVSEAEFREAKRGGYNIRDVDDFLDQVAFGLGQMQERMLEALRRAESAEGRVLELQRELDEARRAPAAGVGAPAPVADASGQAAADADDTLRRTLVLAQRTADATIKDAKEEAARLVDEAQQEAARTKASAEANAMGDIARAREEAQAEADRLLTERDEIAAELKQLESHFETQRDKLRADVDELQRLLDEPDLLSPTPAPPLRPVSLDPPAPASSQELHPEPVPPPPELPMRQPLPSRQSPVPQSPAAESVPSAAEAPLLPPLDLPGNPSPAPASSAADVPPMPVGGDAVESGFTPGARLSSDALSPQAEPQSDDVRDERNAPISFEWPPGGAPAPSPSGGGQSSSLSASGLEPASLPDFGPAIPEPGQSQAEEEHDGFAPSPAGDSFGAEPERPPLPRRGEGVKPFTPPNLADLQEMPSALRSPSGGNGQAESPNNSIFPSSPAPAPERPAASPPPPEGAQPGPPLGVGTGFLPNLPEAFGPPSAPDGNGGSAPNSPPPNGLPPNGLPGNGLPGNGLPGSGLPGGNGLPSDSAPGDGGAPGNSAPFPGPIDAPPPPPPSALDQIRPSEWGRSAFDDDAEDESAGRFGRG